MSRSRIRVLMVASTIWVFLIVVGAYLTYPVIGPVGVVSIEPNLFWSADFTENPGALVRVDLKVGTWLVWSLAPVALLWIAAAVFARSPSQHAA